MGAAECSRPSKGERQCGEVAPEGTMVRQSLPVWAMQGGGGTRSRNQDGTASSAGGMSDGDGGPWVAAVRGGV